MADDGRSGKALLAARHFDYDEAFKRNLGWITDVEQQRLRLQRVAIGGVGGVGGFHLLTLARLGVGKFTIADFDRFELANFNRQVGATLDALGRPKTTVMVEAARAINPELDIRAFPEGIAESTIDAFLDDVDLYVDGLDFFVLDLREKLFARCQAKAIPIIIAAPIGMGSGYLVFMPGRMTPDQWFRTAGLDQQTKRIHFLLGLTPRMWQQRYLVDRARVDLQGERGPSTVMSCELCAAVAGVEALKILIGRGKVWAVPHYHHFDPFLGRYARGWLPGGNAHPLQRLKIALVGRLSRRLSASPRPEEPRRLGSEIEQILDQARWAPSADNCQPWRFAILDDRTVRIRTPAGARGNVYQYNDGEPDLVALGGLIETMRIAATKFSLRADWTYEGIVDGAHRTLVRFRPDPTVRLEELVGFIATRSVDRRPYRWSRLTAAEKVALASAWGPDLEVNWIENPVGRFHVTRLVSKATEIRLRIPEAYDVHRSILDWNHRFSPTGLPVGALGLSPISVRIMRWAMQSWTRLDRLNRWARGTWLARWEMDWRPGLSCAAHVVVTPAPAISQLDPVHRCVRIGEGLQRFWLTATKLGLAMQPELAPLAFAAYANAGVGFTTDSVQIRAARRVADMLARLLGPQTPVFLGRIGRAPRRAPTARSIRLPLAALLEGESGAVIPAHLNTDAKPASSFSS